MIIGSLYFDFWNFWHCITLVGNKEYCSVHEVNDNCCQKEKCNLELYHCCAFQELYCLQADLFSNLAKLVCLCLCCFFVFAFFLIWFLLLLIMSLSLLLFFTENCFPWKATIGWVNLIKSFMVFEELRRLILRN